MKLTSVVPGFVGPCAPVWVNRNQVCRRLDGGVTGFFKLTRWGVFRVGDEFHGIIRQGLTVESTAPLTADHVPKHSDRIESTP